ncbi:MAG: hypothetical protein LBT22_01800 [Peptococcaceae bacterium]|nr:hypothetical protein [Peptococcaceae bacterium]
MEEYGYQIRPLVIPGGIFIGLYPVLLGLLNAVLHFPSWEVRLFAILYGVTCLSMMGLWLFGRSKSVMIAEDKIVFHSWLGERVIRAKDVKRMVFFRDKKRREIIQIKTKDKLYYLNDFYFPFSEMMSDVEEFIRKKGIPTRTVKR